MKKMNTKKYVIFTLILFCGWNAYCRCVDFDFGSPNFCAIVKPIEKVRVNHDDCFYESSVTYVSKALPLNKEYPYYVNLLRSENKFLVKFEKEFCDSLALNSEYKGIVVAQCNDLMGDEFFGLGNFIRKIFGNERLYQKFNFSKEPHVDFVKEGIKKVSCP